MIKVGFCGASHLGLCYSVASAEKGFKVICFDFDPITITRLKKMQISIDEPKLNNLIKKNKNKLSFTNKISELSSCDFVYFSYDVNTNDLGESDKGILKKKIEKLIMSLKKNIPLIILSQVPPGFTRSYNKLKKELYYQVETLIFGNAINRALRPERFIIGCNRSEKKLFKLFEFFLSHFNCPILKMKYESAELAKIAINCYLASNVSLTNTLVEVSKQIGASWEEIVPTLKLDKRIGKHSYLKPGLGISGGNIERDLITIKKIGEENSTNISLIKSIINLSKYSKMWLYRKVDYYLKKYPKKKVVVLGLSYKENTNSIKNSPSINLLKKINKNKIKTFDPLVKNLNIKNVILCSSSYNAIIDGDILVIATPWKEFKELNLKVIRLKMKGNIIIDPYKIFNQNLALKLGFDYSCII